MTQASKKPDKDLYLFEHDGRREFKVHAHKLQLEVFAQDPVDIGVSNGEVILAFPDDEVDANGRRSINKLYRFLVNAHGQIANITSLHVSSVALESDHFALKVLNIAGSGDQVLADAVPRDAFHNFLRVETSVMKRFQRYGACFARGHGIDTDEFIVPVPPPSSVRKYTRKIFFSLRGMHLLKVDFENDYPVAVHGAGHLTGKIAGFLGSSGTDATACELEFSSPGELKTIRLARVSLNREASGITKVDESQARFMAQAGFDQGNIQTYIDQQWQHVFLALTCACDVPYEQEGANDFWTTDAEFRRSFVAAQKTPIIYVLVDREKSSPISKLFLCKETSFG